MRSLVRSLSRTPFLSLPSVCVYMCLFISHLPRSPSPNTSLPKYLPPPLNRPKMRRAERGRKAWRKEGKRMYVCVYMWE